MAKTTAAKKLAQETGISFREVERYLDANVFLDKDPRWVPLGSHCPFLLHQMFTHATATGQKEHGHTIYWDWWQPSPEWDLGVEPSAMDLVGPQMSWAKIRVIYNEVYQLWKLPGRSPCDKETGERICQEILDSIKECLWHRPGSHMAGGRAEAEPYQYLKTDAQAEFQARTCATYNHYKNMQQDSCAKL